MTILLYKFICNCKKKERSFKNYYLPKYQLLRFLSFIIWIFCAFNAKAQTFSSSIFEFQHINEALIHAKKVNKPIFIDFYADWCAPCKWMDASTFSDEEVIGLLRDKFITVKVNIDDFDGINEKEKYDVKVLPTIIITDSKGKILLKKQESIGITSMKILLKDFDIKNHLNKGRKSDAVTISSITENVSGEIIPSSTSFGGGLVHVPYRMQMGVFLDSLSAIGLSSHLQSKFIEPISIQTELSFDSTTLYKVVMGEFYSRGEAESYSKYLVVKHKLAHMILAPAKEN